MATVKLDIDKSYNNDIYFKWQPPENSKCYANNFMLIISQKHITDVESVLDRDNKVCDGIWTATVYNEESKKSLAKAHL
ncbi:hypothetical protein [Francisella sciaenopsi]|uniref:Uncharacterized protein n=1 Tax=Francisella sciaenopsi TaxID=3055034 RepID=A0ABQ6PFC0_9GAMM